MVHFHTCYPNNVVYGVYHLDCTTGSRSQSWSITFSWWWKNHELTAKEITRYKLDLEKDLFGITDAKDTEISYLNKEIENLKTKVEFESIHAEIYNLKMLAQQK